MTQDVAQSTRLANSAHFALNDDRRRVSDDMPRPDPAPAHVPLPEPLQNVGSIDEQAARRHQRRARRRGQAEIPPSALDGIFRIPPPISFHTQMSYSSSMNVDINLSATCVDVTAPSSSSFPPASQFCASYPFGPSSSSFIPSPHFPFSYPPDPSSSSFIPSPQFSFSHPPGPSSLTFPPELTPPNQFPFSYPSGPFPSPHQMLSTPDPITNFLSQFTAPIHALSAQLLHFTPTV